MSAPAPRDWSVIKALFMEAVELPLDQREVFLTQACGADEELRAEVEALLAAHEDERPFLDVVPIAGGARVLSAALEDTERLVTRLAPNTRFGQYEVLEPLGSGGMGDVYRARDTKLGRSVALKIVLDSAPGQSADRVLREARAASALNHPNVCTLYEAGEVDGQPYLAMEYIAGEPLDSLIPPEGFDARDVAHYSVQIADALTHAHEHGVIHRDLKAANVVVTPQRRAKVLDFGIARQVPTVNANEAPAVLTEGGRITAAATARSGTPAYMAPELLRGHTADARSDIWALGVLLYEMASGRRPFIGNDAFEVTSAITNDSPPPLPARVPSGLRAVIVRCLARDPADRFQHASEALAALEACNRVDRTTVSGFRRSRSVLTVSVAAPLLVGAYAVYQWRGGVPPIVLGSAPVSPGVGPRNPELSRLYLRGRAELARNTRSSTESAVAVFQSAVDLDGEDALAHAGLALAGAKMRLLFANEKEQLIWHTRAHQAAQRALQLDRDRAETHEALAAVYRSTEFDWFETIAESAQALARNRSLDQPHLFRASAFMHLGLLDRAHSEAAAAMENNAANKAEPLRVQGAAATYGGQYEVAVSLLEQASAKSDEPAEWNLAYAYYNFGRKAEGKAMLRRIRGDSVRSQRRAQATLASFLAAEGETQEATKLIDAVLAGPHTDHHVAYALGAAYAQLGRPKEALRWLAESRSSGFRCYPWFTTDPLLMPLKKHSAFLTFLDEFKQSWETQKAQLGADR